MMTPETIQQEVNQIASKREFLLKLLERSDLGNLRIDVTQALEELEELIEECQQTFPQDTSSN